MLITPPKGFVAPNPRLSSRITSTLGAPCGALTSNRGGGVALRTSSSVIGEYCGSAIGNTVRFSGASCAQTDSAVQTTSAAIRIENQTVDFLDGNILLTHLLTNFQALVRQHL